MSEQKARILTHMDILTDPKLTWIATESCIMEMDFGAARDENSPHVSVGLLELFVAKMGKRGFKRNYCFMLPGNGGIRIFKTAKEARAAIMLRKTD